MGHLEEIGADAKGAVGADDPLLAFEDAIRQFGPDHILIALRSEEHAGCQERGLLDQVLEKFTIPLTVFQPRNHATGRTTHAIHDHILVHGSLGRNH